MKAWVLHDVSDIRYEELKGPSPRKDEAIVKVEAAGICGSDINRVFRDGMHNMPSIPGHEFSGTVVETGSMTNEKWKGKRVGVFPLIPCKVCDSCKDKKYEMCRNYQYLGSRNDGGFAEYVSVPAWNLIEIPEQISFEQAAMLEPIAVAVHAARQAFGADLRQADQTKEICIHGLGTIGLLLCAILSDAGFEKISVIGKKDIQKKMASELGIAPDRISSFDDSTKREAEVYFDCVGTIEAVKSALQNTRPGGIVVMVGNPDSDMNIDKQTYWKILRNQLTLIGTWNSSFTHEESDDWHYALKRCLEGGLSPERLITHSYSMADLLTGFEIMRGKTEDYVKEMMIV